jgi:MFS family permease
MNSTHATDITLRGVGVCCALGNTALHTLLIPDHLEEKFYVGVLFAVGSAVMLVVVAALIAPRRPMVAWLAGALVSGGMIVGFLLSRTVGLPDGYYEPGWEAPYGPLSLLVEGVFILAFLVWLGLVAGVAPAPELPYRARQERVTPRRSASKGW